MFPFLGDDIVTYDKLYSVLEGSEKSEDLRDKRITDLAGKIRNENLKDFLKKNNYKKTDAEKFLETIRGVGLKLNNFEFPDNDNLTRRDAQ